VTKEILPEGIGGTLFLPPSAPCRGRVEFSEEGRSCARYARKRLKCALAVDAYALISISLLLFPLFSSSRDVKLAGRVPIGTKVSRSRRTFALNKC